MATAPAVAPCGSCPYRRDVPSGVWVEEEYAKLPPYDAETALQPPAVFLCHQQDGRLCAGWAGCHDMDHNLGLRMAAAMGTLSPEDVQATLDYTTSVPLFESGEAAARHGRADTDAPGEKAQAVVGKLLRRRDVS